MVHGTNGDQAVRMYRQSTATAVVSERKEVKRDGNFFRSVWIRSVLNVNSQHKSIGISEWEFTQTRIDARPDGLVYKWMYQCTTWRCHCVCESERKWGLSIDIVSRKSVTEQWQQVVQNDDIVDMPQNWTVYYIFMYIVYIFHIIFSEWESCPASDSSNMRLNLSYNSSESTETKLQKLLRSIWICCDYIAQRAWDVCACVVYVLPLFKFTHIAFALLMTEEGVAGEAIYVWNVIHAWNCLHAKHTQTPTTCFTFIIICI